MVLLIFDFRFLIEWIITTVRLSDSRRRRVVYQSKIENQKSAQTKTENERQRFHIFTP